ncbi:MAG: hypothetical protein WDN67_02055 [Candidatus Moraniibacteriota bacterium]
MTPETPKVHHVFEKTDIEKNRLVAALSYLGLLFLIPLLLKTDSPFAQFHARQGLVLAIVFFIGSFFFWIPLFGWAAFIMVALVDIYALIKTLSGEAWEVPGAQTVLQKLNL